VLVEEAVLALLWFHPAVWWLVGELQLAREQVVDRLTVAATGARRAYMDALFSAADAPSAPPLLAGFLRRRHLARRLVALAEEVVMSRVRLAVGGVLVLGVLAASSAVALAAWPLVPAQREPDTMMFQAKLDGRGQLGVVRRAEIEVPGGLSQEMASATLLLDLVVDAQGKVMSVRPVSFSIRNEAGANLSSSDLSSLATILEKLSGQMPAGKPVPFPDRTAVRRDLEAMLTASAAALSQWQFDAPAASPAIARLTTQFDLTANRVLVGPPSPVSGFAGAANRPVTTFVVRDGAPRSADGVLRVGGNIGAPQKVHNVAPDYPAVARDAKVQGIVVIGITVGPDGSVAEAWVERSVPLLDEAALDAVRQWRYSPTLLNGVAVPVRMTVTVNFTLSEG
jgi:TonB family protein